MDEERTVNIGDRAVGFGHPTFIVAELSSNHGQSWVRCQQLVEAAHHAGADAVKLQCYTPLEMEVLRGKGPAPEPWAHLTLPRLYESHQTPWEWFPHVFARAAELGMVGFSSVFGLASLHYLESIGCPAYKIAAPDCDNTNLISAARITGKPVFISSNNQKYFVDDHANTAYLWCPKGYPPLAAALDLHRIRFWDGLSCHYPDPLLGILAVARKAWVLEFHLKLEDDPTLPDDAVSLTPQQFEDMVKLVRQAEAFLLP